MGPLKNKAEAKAEARRATQRAEAKAQNEAKASGRVDVTARPGPLTQSLADLLPEGFAVSTEEAEPEANTEAARRPPASRHLPRRLPRRKRSPGSRGPGARKLRAEEAPKQEAPKQAAPAEEAPEQEAPQGSEAGSAETRSPQGCRGTASRGQQAGCSQGSLCAEACSGRSGGSEARGSSGSAAQAGSPARSAQARSTAGRSQAGQQEDQLVQSCARLPSRSKQPARRPQGLAARKNCGHVCGYVRRSVPMPKMKTHSGAKKRFKLTGSGKLKPPAGQPPPLPRAQVLQADPSPRRRQDRLQGRRQGHPEDARHLSSKFSDCYCHLAAVNYQKGFSGQPVVPAVVAWDQNSEGVRTWHV